MLKLKKREIIILAVTIAVLLGAVVYKFFIQDRPGKKVETAKESVKIEKVISGLTEELNKNKLSDFDNLVIKKAQADWGGSPFLKRDLYKAWLAKDRKGVGPAVNIIYSGYVDTGKNKLAVLNGIEYRIGEELKEKGFILKNISSSKVIIFDKNADINMDIPIQE